jgi:hypothetical protein
MDKNTHLNENDKTSTTVDSPKPIKNTRINNDNQNDTSEINIDGHSSPSCMAAWLWYV